MALSIDPLWPRSGDWPSAQGGVDLGLVGIPTHATSLSATNAHLTPAAVRDALRYYSEFTDRPLALRFADFGDASDPDADEESAIRFAAAAASADRRRRASYSRAGKSIRVARLIRVSTLGLHRRKTELQQSVFFPG